MQSGGQRHLHASARTECPTESVGRDGRQSKGNAAAGDQLQQLPFTINISLGFRDYMQVVLVFQPVSVVFILSSSDRDRARESDSRRSDPQLAALTVRSEFSVFTFIMLLTCPKLAFKVRFRSRSVYHLSFMMFA